MEYINLLVTLCGAFTQYILAAAWINSRTGWKLPTPIEIRWKNDPKIKVKISDVDPDELTKFVEKVIAEQKRPGRLLG